MILTDLVFEERGVTGLAMLAKLCVFLCLPADADVGGVVPLTRRLGMGISQPA